MLDDRFGELEKKVKATAEIINRLKQERIALEIKYADATKKIEELTVEMAQRRREEDEFSDRIEELLDQFKDFPEEEGNGYQEGFTVINDAADYDDAEPELTLENERDINDYLAQFEAGRAYEKKGLWNKAIEAYRRAIDVKPDFVDAIEHLAFLLEKLNREKEASPLWEKVISLKK